MLRKRLCASLPTHLACWCVCISAGAAPRARIIRSLRQHTHVHVLERPRTRTILLALHLLALALALLLVGAFLLVAFFLIIVLFLVVLFLLLVPFSSSSSSTHCDSAFRIPTNQLRLSALLVQAKPTQHRSELGDAPTLMSTLMSPQGSCCRRAGGTPLAALPRSRRAASPGSRGAATVRGPSPPPRRRSARRLPPSRAPQGARGGPGRTRCASCKPAVPSCKPACDSKTYQNVRPVDQIRGR